jgi:hypothetical protein
MQEITRDDLEGITGGDCPTGQHYVYQAFQVPSGPAGLLMKPTEVTPPGWEGISGWDHDNSILARQCTK